MGNRIEKIYLTALWILPMAVATFVFFLLPERIPVHWDASGQIDGWGGRYTIFILPAIVLAIGPLIELLPRLSKNYERIKRPLFFIECAAAVLFNFIFLFIVFSTYRGLHDAKNPMQIRLLLPVIGIFLAFIGNLLPKFKQNWFCGIRTPWTLSSGEVWYRTHRFSGHLWVGGGIILAAGAFILSSRLFFLALFIPCMLVLCIVPIVYSYVIAKRIGKDKV